MYKVQTTVSPPWELKVSTGRVFSLVGQNETDKGSVNVNISDPRGVTLSYGFTLDPYGVASASGTL